MADPLIIASDRLAPAFRAVAGPGAGDVDPIVRPSERADAQANGVLGLAKQLGRPPRDVAADVVAAAQPLDDLGVIEIAGAGFLNITFSDAVLGAALAAVSADDRLGVRPVLQAETVVVDYSAPNVAKEMHVGHLRTTVIGDALVRLMTFVGHRVVKENHIGDWGTPFGMLIEHLADLGASSDLEIRDLDGFYRDARVKFDASDEFKVRARNRVVLLQSDDPETMQLWRILVAQSTKHFNEVYRKLGVLLTDDDLAAEACTTPSCRVCSTDSRRPACSSRATARTWCSRPGTPTVRVSRCR